MKKKSYTNYENYFGDRVKRTNLQAVLKARVGKGANMARKRKPIMKN